MAQHLCVATLQEAEAIIAKFEVEHTVQFSTLSTTKNFGKDLNNDCVRKGKISIRLKEPQPGRTRLVINPADDSPFAILGKKVMDCIHGRDYKINEKIKKRESKAILGMTQRREVTSKRKDCPAKIAIRHIVSFTGFKEAKTTSKQIFTRNLRKKLRNNEPVPHEHQFHIHLPDDDEHANHPTGKDAGLQYSMAAPLRVRIQELAQLGVHSPAAIKIHLRFLVENELFKGKTPPPKSNCMYWPTHQAIYGCVYRYKQGARPTRIKHFNRNYEAVPHNLIHTQKTDLLHQIVDEVGLDETVDRTVENATVSAPKRLKTKTTSTHGNRLSNPSLQHNEATTLTSLSLMDGTKQNSLPTIKVVNPSHYLGEGQLFLNNLTSQEQVIDINANAPNMAKKVQRKRKGTHLDGDAQQQGHFFELLQIQQNSNGVEEGQTSLVFVPSEAMHEWSDSLEIETTPTTSQQICQPSIETSLEAQGAFSDQCVLVEVQESPYASEVESIYQQLPSTDCSSLVTDTYLEEVSVLTSHLDGIESQRPTVSTNHSAPLWSSSFSELSPEPSTTDSLHHIVHDHDYGNSLGKESLTAKPVDVSRNASVQRQESNLKPNLELPTSCIEHLKDLLETRDIPNIVSAFLNVPSLKLELVQQLVKKY